MSEIEVHDVVVAGLRDLVVRAPHRKFSTQTSSGLVLICWLPVVFILYTLRSCVWIGAGVR